MIPIGDRIPTNKRPIVTYLLITINIVVFIWEWQLDISGQLNNVVNTWGVVPSRLVYVASTAFTTLNPAAWIALLLLQTALIKAMFLHSSFSHLIGNLLFLFGFGKILENLLGHLKFLSLYLLCGVATFGVQILAEPTLNLPLIGANGAIAGVLGAYLSKFSKAKIDTILPLIILFIPIELPAVFYLYWWFIQQLFYDLGSLSIFASVNSFSLGYWMHGVGLIIGFVLVRSVKIL